MNLRRVELLIPSNGITATDEELAECNIIDKWTTGAGPRVAVTIICALEDVEQIIDRVEKRLGAGNLRATISPAEATLPIAEKAAMPGPRPKIRISRQELYQDVHDNAKLSPIFLAMTVLAAVVAILGLHRDSVAVVIGAMVMAPLLGPHIGLALATTLGDKKLAGRSLKSAAIGTIIPFFLALLVGFVWPVEAGNGEIYARTELHLADIGIALAAGIAGSLAMTQGLPSGVIGVMVAVALLPPLASGALLLGSGQLENGLRALTLLATNIVAVNLGGIATFLIQGIRPNRWWQAERARRATMRAAAAWTISLLLFAALVAWIQFRP